MPLAGSMTEIVPNCVFGGSPITAGVSVERSIRQLGFGRCSRPSCTSVISSVTVVAASSPVSMFLFFFDFLLFFFFLAFAPAEGATEAELSSVLLASSTVWSSGTIVDMSEPSLSSADELSCELSVIMIAGGDGWFAGSLSVMELEFGVIVAEQSGEVTRA